LEFRRVFFCSQAEDGIRDWSVTGVQTCALPISGLSKKYSLLVCSHVSDGFGTKGWVGQGGDGVLGFTVAVRFRKKYETVQGNHRSEEHTSELQSLTNLVCRLLLEKKK